MTAEQRSEVRRKDALRKANKRRALKKQKDEQTF